MTKIEMFLDYACPFSYLGFSIADKLRKEENHIKFKFFPYELNPGGSKEVSNITDSIDEDVLIESYKRIESLGKEYALVYKNKTKAFNTHRLLLAGIYSQRQGKFYDFSKEAYKTVFEDGKNVAKVEVVNEIAIKVGLNIVEMNNRIDSGELESEFERAKSLISSYEVDSVPTFIINNGKKLTKLKAYSEFKKDLIE